MYHLPYDMPTSIIEVWPGLPYDTEFFNICPFLHFHPSGQGGRIAAGGSTLSRYVAMNIALTKREDLSIGPREAILRHAKEAEENPMWIAPAYKQWVEIHRV